MSATFVQIAAQQEDQDNAAAAWALTVDANTTSGNRLLLLVQQEDALVSSVADSKSNSWSKVLDLTTGAGMFPSLWTCQLASALTTSDTITVTKNAAGNRPTSATCIEIAGADTSSGTGSIRVTATNTGATGNNPASTGTTATDGLTDDLAVACWTVNDTATYASQTNSFSERADFGTLAGGTGFVHHCIATKTLVADATVECSATRTGGSGLAWSAAMVVVKAAVTDIAPENTVAPAITGTTEVGQTLTCSDGTWTGTPTPDLTYQWYVADSPDGYADFLAAAGEGATWDALSGETAATLDIDGSLLTKFVWCQVTATNTAGTAAEPSGYVGFIYAVLNTDVPEITGSPVEGETLSCSTGTWLGSPTGYAYGWQRDGAPIVGATSSTYALIADDVGAMISCIVTASDADGSVSSESLEVGPVEAAEGGGPDPDCYVMAAGGLVTCISRRMTADGLFPPLT